MILLQTQLGQIISFHLKNERAKSSTQQKLTFGHVQLLYIRFYIESIHLQVRFLFLICLGTTYPELYNNIQNDEPQYPIFINQDLRDLFFGMFK